MSNPPSPRSPRNPEGQRGGLAADWPAGLLLTLLLAALPLYAAETNPPATPSVGSFPLNLQAQGYQDLRKAYLDERAPFDGPRTEKLTRLINKYLAEANQMLAEKQAARNIKGIAVANASKAVFETALGDLKDKKEFELPAKVRRELEPIIAQFQEERAAIEQTTGKELGPIRDRYFARFRDMAVRSAPAGKTPSEAWLRTRFDDLISGKAPAEGDLQPAATTNAPPGTAALGPATNAAPAAESGPPAEIIAATGEATKWITAFRWTAEMMGMDVVSIPVTGRTQNEDSQALNPVSGQYSKLHYQPTLNLPERDDFVYRLKRIPGAEPVSVLEWPKDTNKRTLLIRTTPSDKYPAPHGFDFQVSLPGQELERLFPSNAVSMTGTAATNGPTVLLILSSNPTGAVVFVDGIRVKREGADFRTPCETRIAPGPHSMRLVLFGFMDYTLNDYPVLVDKRVHFVMRQDPRAVKRDLSVTATAGWTASGVKVDAGDAVAVDAQGQWACGAKKERCGPDGYPNNKDYFHYYLSPQDSPRQLNGANYGALLMRISETGTPMAVGAKYRGAAKGQGMLFFDINEIDDPHARRDNSGSLAIKLYVSPR